MNQSSCHIAPRLCRLGASFLLIVSFVAASFGQASLKPPKNLKASTSDWNSVTLVWMDASNSETGFEIERSDDGSAFAQIGMAEANTKTYTDLAIPAATRLEYRIRAVAGDAASAWSNVAALTRPAPPPPLPPVPAVPTSLTAVAVSSTQIDLAWTDNATNEDGFEVSVSRNGKKWSVLPRLDPNTTQYRHTGLAPSSVYMYKVRAFNAAGGEWTDIVSAQTLAAPPLVDLLSLTVSPSTVLCGSPATGQVNLTAVAPEGGLTVTVTDTSALVSTPVSVFVPAGVASVRFTITTEHLTVSESAVLQAELNETIRSTTMTVSPTAPPEGKRTYYVAPSGSDSAAGTIEEPWKTLSMAFASLAPGDTLYVRGGAYAERVQFNFPDATADEPILVMAYPDERPVLSGLLWITGADYWTFDGLNVTWNPDIGIRTDHMVKCTNGTGWTFRNAELWGAHSFAGLLVAGTVPGEPAAWTVSHNVIHDIYPSNSTNQDHCMYVNTGPNPGHGVIERNLLYNATNGEGIKIAGTDENGASSNITVRYNTIYNTAQSILVGGLSHDIVIYRNLMGLTQGSYAHLRSYLLKGENNVAYDNLGFAAGAMFWNDTASYPGIQDAGGNLFPVDPLFDSYGPDGFTPTNPEAEGYGHTAP